MKIERIKQTIMAANSNGGVLRVIGVLAATAIAAACGEWLGETIYPYQPYLTQPTQPRAEAEEAEKKSGAEEAEISQPQAQSPGGERESPRLTQ